jgi:NAD(P)-dependent dehydrogenase (short-subunit alcohol dehydrogenase family)
VVLITGASAGLGRALALALAKPGVRIGLNARRADLLEAVAADIRRRGAEALVIPGDVSADQTPRALVETVRRAWGPITHLVTNASSLGVVPLAPVADVPDGGWLEAVYTNLLGTVRLWREVLPAMEAAAREGVLLTISSDAAIEAYPHWGPYGATKAAVDHLVRILAAELHAYGKDHVRVYAVDPGDMDTAMHRVAIPDADPRDLQDPGAVAPVLRDLLWGARSIPSGRYTLAEIRARVAGDPR